MMVISFHCQQEIMKAIFRDYLLDLDMVMVFSMAKTKSVTGGLRVNLILLMLGYDICPMVIYESIDLIRRRNKDCLLDA